MYLSSSSSLVPTPWVSPILTFATPYGDDVSDAYTDLKDILFILMDDIMCLSEDPSWMIFRPGCMKSRIPSLLYLLTEGYPEAFASALA
jgi:hypothetical protein